MKKASGLRRFVSLDTTSPEIMASEKESVTATGSEGSLESRNGWTLGEIMEMYRAEATKLAISISIILFINALFRIYVGQIASKYI